MDNYLIFILPTVFFFLGMLVGYAINSKNRCKHQWKSHSKEKREKGVYDREQGKEIWLKDVTREVLICEHCGKIKTIEY